MTSLTRVTPQIMLGNKKAEVVMNFLHRLY